MRGPFRGPSRFPRVPTTGYPADACGSRSWFLQVNEVIVAIFLPADIDPLGQRGWNIFTDERGFDGQLPMSAIDQDGELDGLGASEVIQSVQRGSDGASAEEYIIDQYNSLARDVEGNGRR